MRIGRTHTERLLFDRRIRPLGQAALELLWPTRCAGCERIGVLLCDDCEGALPHIDQEFACPRCGAPAGSLVCTECTPAYERVAFAFAQARCALEFSELTRRVVVAYKDGGERRLAPVLARFVARAIPLEWRRWADALTWVPADPKALRRRGFDHMELIARALSAQIGLPAAAVLDKRARVDQRGLGRAQRRENMSGVFVIRDAPAALSTGQAPATLPTRQAPATLPDLRAARLILIDDVFTTGATLDAATRTLLTAGVAELRVATVARVW